MIDIINIYSIRSRIHSNSERKEKILGYFTKLELKIYFPKTSNTSNCEYIIACSYFTIVAQQTYVEFNSSAQLEGSIFNGINKNY